jgi:hypothetical protein
LLLGDKQERSFNVFFGAKNGFWTQRYRLRKVDGQWRDSVVVDRLNFRTNNYEKIMDKTDPLFGPAMP